MTALGNEPFVEVFSGSLWEAEVVKGLLESNNMKTLKRDETLGSVTSPYAGIGGEVKVLVDKADFEAAQELINNREMQKGE